MRIGDILDIKSILDNNNNDKLTLYSFEKTRELHEQKVQKFKTKGIKKSAEVLNTRMELKVQVENLNNTFLNLLVEQDNLQAKEKIINDTSEKNLMMETKIDNLEMMMSTLKPKELEEKLRQLNEELNNKISTLSEQTTEEQWKTLVYNSDTLYTVCHTCKKNCHDPCD